MSSLEPTLPPSRSEATMPAVLADGQHAAGGPPNGLDGIAREGVNGQRRGAAAVERRLRDEPQHCQEYSRISTRARQAEVGCRGTIVARPSLARARSVERRRAAWVASDGRAALQTPARAKQPPAPTRAPRMSRTLVSHVLVLVCSPKLCLARASNDSDGAVAPSQ
jgi:hypothetical protein